MFLICVLDKKLDTWPALKQRNTARAQGTVHLRKWLQLPFGSRLATGLQQASGISRGGADNDCMCIVHWPAVPVVDVKLEMLEL